MAVPADQVIIESSYNGPPGSGNGGYACGLAAGACTHGPAEVTLRKPPPLSVPMAVIATAAGAELRDGETVVATIAAWDGLLDVPAPPSVAAVEAAMRNFDLPSYADPHPFPTCFTCGPSREAGSGLGIYPGRPGGGPGVIWQWTPDPSLDEGDGRVADEIMWAALDCPGAHAWLEDEASGVDLPVVLGRLAARIDQRAVIGSRYLTMGWQIGQDGRKLQSGTAVWSEDGALQALARATWIVLDPEQAAAFTAV